MIKMVVSDIDGTLIPIGGRMSDRTRETLLRCCSKGVLFVPASGRTFFGAVRLFSDIQLDCPVISANGGRVDAHCYESPLFEDCIDVATARHVCECLISAGCYMTSYIGTKVYTLPETNGYNSQCVKVSEAAGRNAEDVDCMRERMRTEGIQKPYKFEAYSDDRALLKELKREFLAMGLSVSGAFEFNLEVMAPGAGKGKAVEYLRQKFDLKKREILALGDGSNDITLLQSSGVAVAMQNASQSLKPYATVIAPDAAEDGAAKVLEEYVLLEREK